MVVRFVFVVVLVAAAAATDDDTMVAGGRVGSQVFYEFEYYNVEGWIPVLLDFRLVEVDDYLDMMVDNKLVIS